MTEIRRNRDGRRNLFDLRRALASRDDRRVYRQGADWIVRRWSPGHEAWVEYNLGPDERHALENALGFAD